MIALAVTDVLASGENSQGLLVVFASALIAFYMVLSQPPLEAMNIRPVVLPLLLVNVTYALVALLSVPEGKVLVGMIVIGVAVCMLDAFMLVQVVRLLLRKMGRSKQA